MRVLSSILLLLAVAASHARELPLHTETVSDFETVIPQIIQSGRSARSAKGIDKEFIVKINKENETLTLHLLLNDKLMAPHFKSISYDDDGNEVITAGAANCYYQGTVEEHPDWLVIMNACGGLKGFIANMNNKTEYYRLEPLSHTATRLDEPHKLITSTQSEEEAGTCGVEGHAEHETITDQLETLDDDTERVRRQSPNGDYIVELAIVNDNRQYVYHGRNLENTVQDAIAIVNAADAIYRPLGVRLVISRVITWTSGDQIAVVSDPSALLERTRAYRSRVTQTHDSLMLVTGLDLSGSTVGIAYLNTMCGSAAVGVTQAGRRSTLSIASTFAHEVGHQFSLNHDSGGCSCTDRSGRCVMAAVSGFPAPERWSSCSVSQLQTSLTRTSNNLGRCLINEPTTIVGTPSCGNGIREGDEVCDCGSAQECDDPCCDPTTCRPRAGAQCTRGECCTSTCQFKAYGTTCRSASGQCDIAEYCSGESSECPTDVSVQDGTTCNNNQAYCFSGECQTYDDQCQYHFGTSMGVRECFTAYNPQGTVFGNCGYTSTDYIPCSQSDAMCGQLFCERGQYQGRVSGVRVTIVTVGVFVNFQSRQCQGFTPEPGTDIMSPGLVRDGTKCSDGKLCYNQRCIAASDVPGTQTCPRANGQECSGRGKCNSRGQCSCNVGFVGSACENVFEGIMVDECATGEHNCEQECVDTEESFFCTCRSGFTLDSDGRSCNIDCGGRLTTASGTFTSPGYPTSYPADGVECEWIIEIPNTRGRIEFTINSDIFGINGRPACTNDHIEFFDGTANSASSLEKICGLVGFYPNGLPIISTTSSTARVVFTGSSLSRPSSRVGVSVSYRTVSSTNECQVDNGGCDHICTDTTDSFQCSCRAGYNLGSDQRSCIDVNECSSNNGGCEQNCQNTVGSFRCTCNSGYVLNGNQKTCSDVNECLRGTDNCAQDCVNTVGSFRCSCRSGFRLNSNGVSCNDINECSEQSDNCAQQCTNTFGSFSCLCNPGYTIASDRQSCLDVNECLLGTHNCQQRCSNTAGSFVCSCNSGYTLANDRRSCVDVNECSLGTHNCQQRCSNTAGSFLCSCNSGYTLANDRRSCVDINECSLGSHNCDQGCSNTAGSFRCSCNSGFTLASDGRTCTPNSPTAVNECLNNNGGCSQICQDTADSFQCSCNSGYTLGQDGVSCFDVNECASNNGGCQQNCFNFQGSYICWCNSGFTLGSDGLSCIGLSTPPPPTTEATTSPPVTTAPPPQPTGTGCGSLLTAESGSLQSPGWPNGYPQDNIVCEWIISLPDSSARIEFTTDDSAFGINGKSPCTNDYIEFFDGFDPTSTSLHKACFYDVPPIITTSSSQAKVIFQGTRNFNRPGGRVGVRVNYRMVQSSTTAPPPTTEVTTAPPPTTQATTAPPPTTQATTAPPPTTASTTSPPVTTAPPPQPTGTGCGSLLTAESGSLQSPGWPNGYPQDNIVCEWIISLPDSSARIEFTTDESAYGINGRPPCTNDYIEFFDGFEPTSTSLHKACRYDVPPVITTSSSQAKVVFRGTRNFNRPNGRVGVRVTYRTVRSSTTAPPPTTEVTIEPTIDTRAPTTSPPVTMAPPPQPTGTGCGSLLTAESGSLQSPGWPNGYPQDNIVCEWIINLPNSNARIEFTTDESAYGINGRSPCTNDYIEFFDGFDPTSTSLHKACFYDVPPVITTSSSQAKVIFRGTRNFSRPGGRVGVRVTYRTVSS